MDWHWITLVLLTTLLMQYGNHMVRCAITDVQLVGGPSSNKGTVEVKQEGGDWNTTCGIYLDINDVIVICRQLGFTGASLAVKTTPYGQNSNPAIGLGCDGREGSLSECPPLLPSSGCSSAGSASCHGEHYLGCFMDLPKNDTTRVFTGDMMTSLSMSISSCINFCNQTSDANYTYAGVENGNECFCGEASDNYTRHGKQSDDQCHVPCSGDPTDSCGGVGHIAVFNILATTMTRPTKPLGSSPPPTTSLLTSTSQTAITGHDVISTSSSSSSSSFSSSLEPQGLYAGIGGGVAAVVIIILVIIVIVCFTRKRSRQERKGIASSQRATLTPAGRPPAYDEINDFAIPNGAMAEASSARSYQPGAQAHSSANSCRRDKNVLLVNLNPRKSSNIYEGTMDETPDTEMTSYASHGATAVKQNSDNRLSVLYATPDKNGSGAQDGYDEINLGIAPYSSFENPKQPTATAKMADRMSVVYAAPDKNDGRNGTSEDMDSLYAMPDKNGNRNNRSDDTSEDVGSLYAMPDKSRGNPDGYDGDQDLYAKTNDSFSGDQYSEMDMVENELYAM